MDDDSAKPVESREAELEGGRMPFLSHLSELRDRVRNAAIAFVIAAIVCFIFSDEIFAWLRQPLFDIWLQHKEWGPPTLVYTELTSPFFVKMSIGLWAGIFVSSPVVFYQLWQFVAPGLYKRERRITVSFAVFSAVFFIAGALFCFELALPKLYGYFLGFNDANTRSMPTMSAYLDLTRDSMLAFGAIFELPLLIYFLALVGLVTHRSLLKFGRWAIVLSFIIGAILTPGPDVVSQLMMALPMVSLYYLSIAVAWRVTLRRERAEAAQRAKENS